MKQLRFIKRGYAGGRGFVLLPHVMDSGDIPRTGQILGDGRREKGMLQTRIYLTPSVHVVTKFALERVTGCPALSSIASGQLSQPGELCHCNAGRLASKTPRLKFTSIVHLTIALHT
jgi:hypothetical protein